MIKTIVNSSQLSTVFKRDTLLAKFTVRCISNSPRNNNEATDLGLYNPSKVTSVKVSRKFKLVPNPLLANDTCQRPLALIFAWMLAKDKHIEKYRQLWFQRGFDVLTVRTSPLDLLFPPIGGQIVAKNLVRTLSELSEQYNEVIVHAFSVGGYQFGETLLLLKAQEYQHILQSIKGFILDSMVYTADAAPGLSRAITLNPIVQPIIEHSIHVFLKLFRNISVKNYHKSENMIINPIVKYPGLFFYSKDDVVSDYRTNEQMSDNWRQLGNRVTPVCWQHSTHVLHYRDHQQEYEEHLDRFIQSINLKSLRTN